MKFLYVLALILLTSALSAETVLIPPTIMICPKQSIPMPSWDTYKIPIPSNATLKTISFDFLPQDIRPSSMRVTLHCYNGTVRWRARSSRPTQGEVFKVNLSLDDFSSWFKINGTEESFTRDKSHIDSISIYVLRHGSTKEQKFLVNNMIITGEQLSTDILPEEWVQIHFPDYDGDYNILANEDSDYDRMSNYEEYVAGTDPNDITSSFNMHIYKNGSEIILTWNSTSGRLYDVTTTENLQEPFHTIAANISANPPTNEWINTSSHINAFYRVNVTLK